MGYYRRFIRNYAKITSPLEKLLRKSEVFQWTDDCKLALDTLKEKLATTPILVHPDWYKQFHVHIDASSIPLGAVLAQLGETIVDHPVYFASRKLSNAERNYTTMEREALVMVYSLQKFHHYLLGGRFKFFTGHSTLKYLVNKPVLQGRICQWLPLFQEFTFEVIVKPGRLNVRPDHLSRLETRENEGSLDNQLPNADHFRVEVVPDYLADIATYLTTG